MKIQRKKFCIRRRRGAASMDYVLIICILLPIVWFLMTTVPRMIQLVYELAILVVGTPFM